MSSDSEQQQYSSSGESDNEDSMEQVADVSSPPRQRSRSPVKHSKKRVREEKDASDNESVKSSRSDAAAKPATTRAGVDAMKTLLDGMVQQHNSLVQDPADKLKLVPLYDVNNGAHAVVPYSPPGNGGAMVPHGGSPGSALVPLVQHVYTGGLLKLGSDKIPNTDGTFEYVLPKTVTDWHRSYLLSKFCNTDFLTFADTDAHGNSKLKSVKVDGHKDKKQMFIRVNCQQRDIDGTTISSSRPIFYTPPCTIGSFGNLWEFGDVFRTEGQFPPAGSLHKANRSLKLNAYPLVEHEAKNQAMIDFCQQFAVPLADHVAEVAYKSKIASDYRKNLAEKQQDQLQFYKENHFMHFVEVDDAGVSLSCRSHPYRDATEQEKAARDSRDFDWGDVDNDKLAEIVKNLYFDKDEKPGVVGKQQLKYVVNELPFYRVRTLAERTREIEREVEKIKSENDGECSEQQLLKIMSAPVSPFIRLTTKQARLLVAISGDPKKNCMENQIVSVGLRPYVNDAQGKTRLNFCAERVIWYGDSQSLVPAEDVPSSAPINPLSFCPNVHYNEEFLAKLEANA